MTVEVTSQESRGGSPQAPRVTPMLAQYLRVKEQARDAILFFRLGDFYEMFFEDAERAAPLLDLTLTSRNKDAPNPVPMCGIPYHAAQGYVGRLLGRDACACHGSPVRGEIARAPRAPQPRRRVTGEVWRGAGGVPSLRGGRRTGWTVSPRRP